MQSTLDWGLPLWRTALGDSALGTGCFHLTWTPAVAPVELGAC